MRDAREIREIELDRIKSIDDFLKEAKKGAFNLRRLGEAGEIIEEMFKNNAKVFLCISGPIIACGLRNVISELLRNECFSSLIVSGANVVHDILISLGARHYALASTEKGRKLDEKLNELGYGRIGEVLVKNSDFVNFEKWIQKVLGDIDEELRRNISVRELLSEIGKRIRDENSFLKAAHEKRIPVFSPGIADSMLGLQMFIFSQDNALVLNVLKDMRELYDIVFSAEKTGAVIIGGGLPKHYILGANMLRGGIDYGVQICLDREEAGSLSGAKLEEAISWSKARKNSMLTSIVGDASMIFPILAAKILKEKER